MRRRELLGLMGGATAWPIAARAQQPSKSYRIGYLGSTPPASASSDAVNLYNEFVGRLRELGYVEGRNLTIERRFTEGRNERYQALADELVKIGSDLIVAPGTDAALAAQAATTSIPVVTVVVGDPVGARLVASLNRPGGNVTGTSSMGADLTGKCLEVLKEMVPKISRVAVLSNPQSAQRGAAIAELEKVGKARQVDLLIVDIRDGAELEAAFGKIRRDSLDALIVQDDAMLFANKERICEFALELLLPSISTERLYPRAGALMSYGAKFQELFREAAGYVDKILTGANPAELPVAQPTRFELVINLKTAKALDLTVPATLLARADEVIE